MRINEVKMYTMYLEAEEFELLYSITKEVGYEYSYDENEKEYIITIDEDELDAIQDKLDYESYIQEYEECNSYQSNRIKRLIIDMNYEL